MPRLSAVGRAALAAATALAALVAPPARAQTPAAPTLLVNTHPDGLFVYDGLHYGGGVWKGVTAGLDATFGPRLARAATLNDRAGLLTFDALWIDQRFRHTPLPEELDNLRAFVLTGRRVVLVGENATWGPWNAAVLGALGGAEGPLLDLGPSPDGPGCKYGGVLRTLEHPLTFGVGAVGLQCGGYAIGGTALFDYNVATLWGPALNVLTLLDANVLDDRFVGDLDGAQFRRNVIAWVANEPVSTVPEPTALALVAVGAAAVGVAARRRGARQA